MPSKTSTPSEVHKTQDSALTEVQRRTALMLASGIKAVRIAEELGISEHQISRWRKQPEFKAEVNLHLNAASEAVVERLRSLAGKAVDCLEAVLNDPKASASDRLKAAQTILSTVGISPQTPAVQLTEKLPTAVTTVDRIQEQEEEQAQEREQEETLGQLLQNVDFDSLMEDDAEFNAWMTDMDQRLGGKGSYSTAYLGQRIPVKAG